MKNEIIWSLIWVMFFLLLFKPVHAFTVDEYSTDITIDPSGNGIVTLSLTFDSTGVKDYISLPAMESVDIDVHDSSGSLRFATINGSALIRPNKNADGYNIGMGYTTASLTSKDGALWKFNYVFNPYEHLQFDMINRMYIRVDLPRGSNLKTFSSGALVATEEDRISVQWAMEDIKIDNPIAFEIEYLTPSTSANSLQHKEKKSMGPSWKNKALVLFFILFISVSFLYGYKRIFSRKAKKEDKLKIDEKVLKMVSDNQNQEKILHTIAEHGGCIRQNTLQRKTKIPKASLSRNLVRLEIKGIISKEKVGNVNEIQLQEGVVEK